MEKTKDDYIHKIKEEATPLFYELFNRVTAQGLQAEETKARPYTGHIALDLNELLKKYTIKKALDEGIDQENINEWAEGVYTPEPTINKDSKILDDIFYAFLDDSRISKIVISLHQVEAEIKDIIHNGLIQKQQAANYLWRINYNLKELRYRNVLSEAGLDSKDATPLEEIRPDFIESIVEVYEQTLKMFAMYEAVREFADILAQYFDEKDLTSNLDDPAVLTDVRLVTKDETSNIIELAGKKDVLSTFEPLKAILQTVDKRTLDGHFKEYILKELEQKDISEINSSFIYSSYTKIADQLHDVYVKEVQEWL